MPAADLTPFSGFNSGFNASPKGASIPLEAGLSFSTNVLLWLRVRFTVQRVSGNGRMIARFAQGVFQVNPEWSLGSVVATGVTIQATRHYLWRVNQFQAISAPQAITDPSITHVAPIDVRLLGYRRDVDATSIQFLGKLAPQAADLVSTSRDFFRV